MERNAPSAWLAGLLTGGALMTLIGSIGFGGAFEGPIAGRSDVHDLGPAAMGNRVEIVVVLKYRNQRYLDELTALQASPGSPEFGRFLTRAQFDGYFAPLTSDYERTVALLERAGLQQIVRLPGRTIIDASGSVAIMERYFNTRIDRVVQDGYGPRYANVTPIHIPNELASSVLTIVGFDNLELRRQVHAPSPAALVPPRDPSAIGGAIYGPTSGYGPLALAQGYDFPVQHGYDGAGRATANVLCGVYVDSDLTAFLAYFQVKRTGPPTKRVSVGRGVMCTPGQVEATLDAEVIIGTAPGTAYYEYDIRGGMVQKGIVDAYDRVVTDNVVDVVNSSFGTCELGNAPFAVATDAIAEQGSAQGITFSAASGDDGSQDNCNLLHVANGVYSPASGPHFVAVGGTQITVDRRGNYVGEVGWSGSGGGVSKLFMEPSWQDVVAANGLRNVPDIAHQAGPPGYAVYIGGAFTTYPIYGTSMAAPAYCAMQTEIDQMHNARAGDASVAIYKVFSEREYSLFHDITKGCNGLYCAKPFYDHVTGIGSPIGYLLGKATK